MEIRERREQLGLTQTDLAIRAGVKQSVLSDIENKKTLRPRIDTIASIARALGCTVDDLIEEYHSAGQNGTAAEQA